MPGGWSRRADGILSFPSATPTIESSRPMIWLFERGTDIVRLVTQYDEASKEYRVSIEWADGRCEREAHTDLASFNSRILSLERQLATEHWTLMPGLPQILADGWRGPMS